MESDNAELNYEVYCIMPSCQDDVEKAAMFNANKLLKDNGFSPSWMPESDCCNVAQKVRTSVYIFSCFRGPGFEHLAQLKCRVFGPQCVLSCLHLKVEIPRIQRPLYNMAMKDLVVNCTQVSKEVRDDIHTKVMQMTGDITKDLTSRVTHLVAGEVGSEKYRVAGRLGKHIMLPEWVEEVWTAAKSRHVHASDEEFSKFRCPIFHKLVICVSGLALKERKQIQATVESEGGKYSGDMIANQCTHLIINEAKGQKYECAQRWQTQVISSQWLFDSIDKGYCLAEGDYRVTRPPAISSVKTSTPERALSASHMPGIGDISCIQNVSALGAVNETTMSGNSTMTQQPDPNSLLNFDLAQVAGRQALDGCKIYLSGFNVADTEKLRRLLNLTGATRFNEISENLTHVVIGTRVESDIATLDSLTHRPHTVTAAWVMDSSRHGRMLPAAPYACFDRPTSPHLPANKASSGRPPPRVDPNDETMADDDGFQEMMSQYLPDIAPPLPTTGGATPAAAGLMASTLDPDDPSTHALPGRNTQDMMAAMASTMDGTSHDVTAADATSVSMQSQVPATQEGTAGRAFHKKVFVILGFEDEQRDILADYIGQFAGKVIRGKTRIVPDYAVVPLCGYPVEMTVGDVVTNAWVQMCIETEQFLPLDSNELFRPLDVVTDVDCLRGCVLSISGFSGTERDCLMRVAELLGARCQEYFVRKANKGLEASTHLITKLAEGTKYLAAKKWGIPALNKRWILDCSTSGKRLPEDKYDIDAVDVSFSRTASQMNSIQCNNVQNEAGKRIHTLGETTFDDGKERGSVPVADAAAEVCEAVENGHVTEESSKQFSDVKSMPGEVEFVSSKNVESLRRSEDPGQKPNDCDLSTSSNSVFTDVERGGPMRAAINASPRRSVMQENTAGNRENTHESSGNRSLADHREQTTNDLRSPSASSQKENNGNQLVTPMFVKTKHRRVKELQETNQMTTSGQRSPNTLANLGIDSPGQFLDPNKSFQPHFQVNAFLQTLDSPSDVHRPADRRNSMSLEDMFTKTVGQCLIQSRQNESFEHIASQEDAPPTTALPLKGLVVSVSRKLASHQAEYNNIASQLGAEYTWTYDNSCTHFIFQGRVNDTSKEFRTARDNRKFIVSPLWLLTCRDEQCRVDESLFPHSYNPQKSISVVTSRGATPRSSRRPVRTPLGHKPTSARDMPLADKPTLQLDMKLDETNGPSVTESVPAVSEDVPAVNEGMPASSAVNGAMVVDDTADKETVCNHVTEMCGTGETQDLQAALKQMEELITAAPIKNHGRRKSRRVNGNSSSYSASDESKSSQAKPLPTFDEHTQCDKRTEPLQSQSVPIAWDDPASRKAREEELALGNNEAFSPPSAGHLRRPSGVMDDVKEVDVERTPTPEPPTIGFPRSEVQPVPDHPLNRAPPVFLLTGMQAQERVEYGALVEDLGGRVLDGQHYHESCTHLIVGGNPTRNEKFLACVSAGKWVLHRAYLEACRERGSFSQEEQHEWGGPGTDSLLTNCTAQVVKLAKAAHRWRKRIQSQKQDGWERCGAFHGWSVILCTDRQKEGNFRRLLEAGGARVIATRPPFPPGATHCFIDIHKIKLTNEELEGLLLTGVSCLKPEYIASFLTDEPPPDVQEYCPSVIAALRASMNMATGENKRQSPLETSVAKRTRRK